MHGNSCEIFRRLLFFMGGGKLSARIACCDSDSVRDFPRYEEAGERYSLSAKGIYERAT